MKLAETNYDNSETGCCARLDAEKWNEQEFIWQEKKFLRDHIRSLFHIPLNFGRVVERTNDAIEGASGYPEDPLFLTDSVSPWRTEVYVTVDRDIPGARIEHLSGTFVSKVFEGSYGKVGQFLSEMQKHVAASGRVAEKTYVYYAYCPKCSKHFGKNEMVLFSKVS